MRFRCVGWGNIFRRSSALVVWVPLSWPHLFFLFYFSLGKVLKKEVEKGYIRRFSLSLCAFFYSFPCVIFRSPNNRRQWTGADWGRACCSRVLSTGRGGGGRRWWNKHQSEVNPIESQETRQRVRKNKNKKTSGVWQMLHRQLCCVCPRCPAVQHRSSVQTLEEEELCTSRGGGAVVFIVPLGKLLLLLLPYL